MLVRLLLAPTLFALTLSAGAQTLPDPATPAPAPVLRMTPLPLVQPDGHRPRIGLVLSGGGARGLAHVGVLRELERAHVPIDAIAGTSMGAIVGGLYASGLRADALEQLLQDIDWDAMFSSRVQRPQLSQRRKEEDYEISSVLEFGVHDGELRAPQGAFSSRGLELLLRRHTLAVRDVADFDHLPIPFRAVSTDMETGEAVVHTRGDLAVALRSSMSVPGAFAPTEVDGRILGDGGLVNNVPVDVARAMGVDWVIVVNVGTPLSGRDALNSAVGLTEQTIAILTEQNVRRSLASLTAHDLLIYPDLHDLSSGDFQRGRTIIARGEVAANAIRERLAAFAVDEPTYASWQAAHHPPVEDAVAIAHVRFDGTRQTNPQRFEAKLRSQVGDPFDVDKAEADARRLAASGDYVRADYRLVRGTNGDDLVFDLEDKPWGPNYLRVGLDLATDFSGHSAFNVKLSHNHHWLTANGTEWRNFIQIGETPSLFSELYHPFKPNIDESSDWFVASYAATQRKRVQSYAENAGKQNGEFLRTAGQFGIDLGQPWGRLGEVRAGLFHRMEVISPTLLGQGYTGPVSAQTSHEDALRLRTVVDQLDFVNFPTRGYRAVAEYEVGERHQQGQSTHLSRGSFQITGVRSWGRNTLALHGQLQLSDGASVYPLDQYSLGGFQQLSGYREGQVTGNALLFGRLNWYRRLSDTPVFARGFFAGASLEAGNAWAGRNDINLSHLRGGGSAYLGADTSLGPIYLGVSYAPRGEYGIVLFIGRR